MQPADPISFKFRVMRKTCSIPESNSLQVSLSAPFVREYPVNTRVTRMTESMICHNDVSKVCQERIDRNHDCHLMQPAKTLLIREGFWNASAIIL